MRHGRAYLVGLAQLEELVDEDERRSAWRQGMASLAAAAQDHEPAALEGLPPETLRRSVRAAIAAGLLDDLGFLSPATGAVALFELASALPPGGEKRELGPGEQRTAARQTAPRRVACRRKSSSGCSARRPARCSRCRSTPTSRTS